MAWATGDQASRFLQGLAQQSAASASKQQAKTAAEGGVSKELKTGLSIAQGLAGVANAGSKVWETWQQEPYWEAQTLAAKYRAAEHREGANLKQAQNADALIKRFLSDLPANASQMVKAQALRLKGGNMMKNLEAQLAAETDPDLRKRKESQIAGIQSMLRLAGTEGDERASQVLGLNFRKGRAQSLLGPEDELGKMTMDGLLLKESINKMLMEKTRDTMMIQGTKPMAALMDIIAIQKSLKGLDLDNPQLQDYLADSIMSAYQRLDQQKAEAGIKRPDGSAYNNAGDFDQDANGLNTLGKLIKGAKNAHSLQSAMEKTGGVTPQKEFHADMIDSQVNAGWWGDDVDSGGQSISRAWNQTLDGQRHRREGNLMFKVQQRSEFKPGDLQEQSEFESGVSPEKIAAGIGGPRDLNSIGTGTVMGSGWGPGKQIYGKLAGDSVSAGQFFMNRFTNGREASPFSSQVQGMDIEFQELGRAEDILKRANLQNGGKFHPKELKGGRDFLANASLVGFAGSGKELEEIWSTFLHNNDATPEDYLDVVEMLEGMAASGEFYDDPEDLQAAEEVIDSMRSYAGRADGAIRQRVPSRDSLIKVANHYIKRNALSYAKKSGSGPLEHAHGRGHGHLGDALMKGSREKLAAEGRDVADTTYGGSRVSPGGTIPGAPGEENWATMYMNDQMYSVPMHNFATLIVMGATMDEGAGPAWSRAGEGFADLGVHFPTEADWADIPSGEKYLGFSEYDGWIAQWNKKFPNISPREFEKQINTPGAISTTKEMFDIGHAKDEAGQGLPGAWGSEEERAVFLEQYQQKDTGYIPKVLVPGGTEDEASIIHNPNRREIVEDENGMPRYRDIPGLNESEEERTMTELSSAAYTGIRSDLLDQLEDPAKLESWKNYLAKRAPGNYPGDDISWQDVRPPSWAVQQTEPHYGDEIDIEGLESPPRAGIPPAEMYEEEEDLTGEGDVQGLVDLIATGEGIAGAGEQMPVTGEGLPGKPISPERLAGLDREFSIASREQPGDRMAEVAESAGRRLVQYIEQGNEGSEEHNRLLRFLMTYDPDAILMINGQTIKVKEYAAMVSRGAGMGFSQDPSMIRAPEPPLMPPGGRLPMDPNAVMGPTPGPMGPIVPQRYPGF